MGDRLARAARASALAVLDFILRHQTVVITVAVVALYWFGDRPHRNPGASIDPAVLLMLLIPAL